MKSKVIVAGHVSLDITPVFDKQVQYDSISSLLSPGMLIQTKGAAIHPGGAVANTGLALKKLGTDVILCGKTGDDQFGHILGDIFSSHGAEGLIIDRAARTSHSVILAIPGIDRIILHDPGANHQFFSADIPEKNLDDAALLHFGYPTLMKSMYECDGAELIKLFRRVKAKNVATSLDLTLVEPDSEAGKVDWQKVLSGVLPYTDFFVPSIEELMFMLWRDHYEELLKSGKDLTSCIDMNYEPKVLADKVMSMGCKVLMLKCGAHGIYYRSAEKKNLISLTTSLPIDADEWAATEGHQRSFIPDRIASGTGAGDTCIAAFLASVMKGYPLKKSIMLAAAEGASTITEHDSLSGLKSLDELQFRIDKGWKTKD